MKKTVLACGLVLIVLSFVTGAFAIEFSAEMVSSAHGQTITSKIFAKDQKVRMEPKDTRTYSIVRGDKQVLWMIMPEQKSYMERKTDPGQQLKVEQKVPGEVSRKVIGSETVDGHPTQKYEVTYSEGGKTDKIYQWMATDIKFPIKMAAADGRWTMEYKNVKIGTQPASLFELPSDYKKVATPSMPEVPGKAGPN